MNVFEMGWVILIAVLVLQLLFAWFNLACLPKLSTYDASRIRSVGSMQGDTGEQVHFSQTSTPLVSVLIPARNERLHIQECLESVLASDTTGFQMEVFVLDDRSEDDTAILAQEIAERDHRVRVLSGVELPVGWMGKSHACHVLVQKARGEWFMFIDADVRVEPSAIRQALAAGCEQGGGLVTGFPYQVTKTWMEKLVVPMMLFTIISHLPIFMVRRSSNPLFTAATGAFLLIHRESYEATGGHAAFPAHLVDDMSLAKAVKRVGDPVTLADVHDVTHTRMYQNGEEVWNGYKKNMYEGMGRNELLLLGTMVMYAIMYIMPLLGMLAGVLSGHVSTALYGFVAMLLGMGVKRVADHAGGKPWWLALLQPVSMACVIAIGLASRHAGKSGKGYVWKGRQYR